MRRKLIKQDAFDRIISESVTTAERELVEAEPILARATGKDFLKLKSFTESTVLYEAADGGFVHAGFEIKNNNLTFNNVEELIIDEESQKEKRKTVLSEMIDAVLVDSSDKAQNLFNNYLGMVRWNEAKKEKSGKMPQFLLDKWNKGKKGKDKKKDEDKEEVAKKAKKAGDDVCEAYITSQNVLDYVNFMKVGPTLAESQTKVDDKGNLTAIRVPVSYSRSENQLARNEWKSLNSKVLESRKKMASVCENQEFCKAITQLKRQNAFADAQGLEEALDHIVQNWSEVLFVTQDELAQIVSEALQVAGVNNFDDKTCEFMAEGIARKAHDCYSERVSQILHLAGAPKSEGEEDAYSFFQSVVENFYPSLDEKFGLERKVFSDLYESLELVHKKSDRIGDKRTKNETVSYLNDLAAVLNNEAKPDLQLAEEAAQFLATIIETNLESGSWTVGAPHVSLNGDHPELAKKAAKGYSPSSDASGNYGSPAPAVGSDDMNYKSGKHSKEMQDHGFGQEGGGDIFPSLNNPYVPKAYGKFTMKGEKGVDQEHHSDASSDTYPSLKNPYVPKASGPVTVKDEN